MEFFRRIFRLSKTEIRFILIICLVLPDFRLDRNDAPQDVENSLVCNPSISPTALLNSSLSSSCCCIGGGGGGGGLVPPGTIPNNSLKSTEPFSFSEKMELYSEVELFCDWVAGFGTNSLENGF